MRRHRFLVLLGVAAVAGLALLLTGCEEEDVVGALRSADVSASTTQTLDLEAVLPLHVDVRTSNGSVTILGTPGVQTASVTVTIRSRGETLEEAQDRIERTRYRVEASNGALAAHYVGSDQDEDVRRYTGVDFTLLVPDGVQIDVDTSNGSIQIEEILAGEHEKGTIRLDTSNGSIELVDCSGTIFADTSNGGIDAIRVTGDIELDTSNGDIWIEAFAGTVKADTSNGSIRFAGRPAEGTLHRLRTSNGRITVRVPSEASIAFDAHVSSGRIQSELPLVGDTEGSDWRADLNPPATTLFELHTSNGTIRIEGF